MAVSRKCEVAQVEQKRQPLLGSPIDGCQTSEDNPLCSVAQYSTDYSKYCNISSPWNAVPPTAAEMFAQQVASCCCELSVLFSIFGKRRHAERNTNRTPLPRYLPESPVNIVKQARPHTKRCSSGALAPPPYQVARRGWTPVVFHFPSVVAVQPIRAPPDVGAD